MAELAQLVSRLEAVVQRLEKVGGGDAVEDDVPEFVEAFDGIVDEHIQPYLADSEKLGEFVFKQAGLFKKGCDELRKFLLLVSKCSEPKKAENLRKFAEVYQGLQAQVKAVSAGDKKNRPPANLRSHLLMVEEAMQVFYWFLFKDMGYKGPQKHVDSCLEQVQFHGNRVMKDDSELRSWVKNFFGFFTKFSAYLKQYHTTGPAWKKTGPEAAVGAPVEAAATPAAVPAAGGAPPPPPPPPPPPAGGPPPIAPKPGSKAPSADGMSAVLAALNRGSDVTKGLKKVTNDMKTHKNPELRKHQTPVPFKKADNAYKSVATAKKPVKKSPPKLELEGKKWIVEHQEGATLKISDCNMKQVVYIYKCTNSTLQIEGKVNSVILDNCKKFGVAISDVVSGVETINCQSVKVQAMGVCPTISIDKTDGCGVWLSNQCLDCQVVTAKSSEMNISIPKGDDGDYVEFPVIEQFKTVWNAEKKAFVTEPAENMG